MKKTFLFALLLVPVLALSACKRTALVNYESESLGTPAGATLAQVAEAIEKAGFSQGWDVKSQEPGRMTLEKKFKGGKHIALVNVNYDTTNFSILYFNSHNLNYRTSGAAVQIHQTYNIWVKLLKMKIQERASAI